MRSGTRAAVRVKASPTVRSIHSLFSRKFLAEPAGV